MMQPKENQEQRVTLDDRMAWMLPKDVRGIRVVSGQAWVSLGLEDMVVNTKETLYIHPDRRGAVITALGHKRLEFELIA
ncbi:MAG: hypothetical protein K8J31_14900 [Anaerolineae bacterium]|nr:hypothetical protein [Anaerolineae bacterium]